MAKLGVRVLIKLEGMGIGKAVSWDQWTRSVSKGSGYISDSYRKCVPWPHWNWKHGGKVCHSSYANRHPLRRYKASQCHCFRFVPNYTGSSALLSSTCCCDLVPLTLQRSQTFNLSRKANVRGRENKSRNSESNYCCKSVHRLVFLTFEHFIPTVILGIFVELAVTHCYSKVLCRQN